MKKRQPIEVEVAILSGELEKALNAHKPSKQAASLAACVLLVSIAEKLSPKECETFGNMILTTLNEVRYGHEVQGGVN